MHVTLRWFRSGIGLALLLVALLAGATLAIVSVPDHMARAVGGAIFAFGAVAAATKPEPPVREMVEEFKNGLISVRCVDTTRP